MSLDLWTALGVWALVFSVGNAADRIVKAIQTQTAALNFWGTRNRNTDNWP